MRALSVRQPWASAIILGGKTLENRVRANHYRGPLLIHASATMTACEHEAAFAYMRENGLTGAWSERFERDPRALPTGGIIGLVQMVGVVGEADPQAASPWFMGPRAFVLEDARPITFVPALGTVTPLIWEPSPVVMKQVHRALR